MAVGRLCRVSFVLFYYLVVILDMIFETHLCPFFQIDHFHVRKINSLYKIKRLSTHIDIIYFKMEESSHLQLQQFKDSTKEVPRYTSKRNGTTCRI